MKLRIKGNSIRLRLLQSEVKRLEAAGTITEGTRFGIRTDQTLKYSIAVSDRVDELSVEFSDNQILVLLPETDALEWCRGDEVGMQRFASYGRLIGSDGYYIDEDMATLMHPQVVLAWLLNDEPIPPQHGAPLRLIVPFRYGARSLKAITDIQFTATTFVPAKPWPT